MNERVQAARMVIAVYPSMENRRHGARTRYQAHCKLCPWLADVERTTSHAARNDARRHLGSVHTDSSNANNEGDNNV